MRSIMKSPDPFISIGDKKTAILLIHGFTGSPAEMRHLGDFLWKNGYTVYAPLLAGHGLSPEEMIKTNHKDWWNSVNEAYEALRAKGYDEIIAIGLSMGGILSLKLAIEKKLKAAVTLAAPIFVYDKKIGYARWLKYFIQFQNKQPKEEHIEIHLASYDRTPVACVAGLDRLIKQVKKNLRKVTIPTLVMQGKKDETVIANSASYIFEEVSSAIKQLKWYDRSTHIMTLDREKNKVFADILTFVEAIK